jgi:hypothetical protein
VAFATPLPKALCCRQNYPVKYFIFTFGTLIAVAGIVLLLRPSFLFDLLRKYQNSSGLFGLAVLVRVILGIALVGAAPTSKFPLAMAILGWVAIVAAIFIGGMGRTRFSKLMAWALGLSEEWSRLSGLGAILFGGFLVYAVQ